MLQRPAMIFSSLSLVSSYTRYRIQQITVPDPPKTINTHVHRTDCDSSVRLTKSKRELETFFFPQSLFFNSTTREGMGMPFFQEKNVHTWISSNHHLGGNTERIPINTRSHIRNLILYPVQNNPKRMEL